MQKLHSRVGRFGIFVSSRQDPKAMIDAAVELEELGYGTLWLGNSTVAQTASVIGATSKAMVGTAIQSIWTNTAEVTAAQFADVETSYPHRLILGLGAGHAQAVARYRRPYSSMVEFLDDLDATENPVPSDRRMLAALGPRMIELARDRSAGALPYLVTADFVAQTRELLGHNSLLAPELGIVLESDPATARRIARDSLRVYLGLTNYVNSWFRLGFTQADMTGGGSDRLVDALIAWGNEEQIMSRVGEFTTAGADHLALQLIVDHTSPAEALSQLRELAPALRSIATGNHATCNK